MMTVVAFIEKLRARLSASDFAGIVAKAKAGEMGFGPKANDWGTADGKG